MSELTGRIIAGRYRVVESVGRGGMAEVYKVWDEKRAAYLAMKVLNADLAEDVVFLRRFKREAHTLAKLQHPNIVRFYGLEEDGDLAFILMDYIQGTTLRREIRRLGKPFPAGRVLEVMRPVCSALHYAHSQGVVHCDVKPANIMMDASGRVLVSDFGIARLSEATTATMAGAGTPAYMAPEQARGEMPTPRTDIYALGILLFEMLTGGERPFTGEYAHITGSTGEKVRWEQMHLSVPSPRRLNPAVSPEVEAVVLKCLAKEPAERYASVMDLQMALERLLPASRGVGNAIQREAAVVPMDHPSPRIPVLPQPPIPVQAVPRRARSWSVGLTVGLLGFGVLAVVGLAIIFGVYNSIQRLNRKAATSTAWAKTEVVYETETAVWAKTEAVYEAATSTAWAKTEVVYETATARAVWTAFAHEDCDPPVNLPGWRTIACDTFLVPGGWRTGDDDDKLVVGTTEVMDGIYRFHLTSRKSFMKHISNEDYGQLSDFLVSAEVSFSGEGDPDAGLLFRYHYDDVSDEKFFYYFVIDADDQEYYAGLYSSGNYTTLIDWTESSAIHAGALNCLSVWAIGSTFTFFINGVEVQKVEDDVLPNGYVGVLVEINSAGKTATFEFDDFLVMAPP